jgi:metal-responsive CopG/Arc/MetJ family transcriptional regulator|tara:strand:+ start:5177 stop:5359 length:183 start_codon:yes stop_codon:yes gene_type:complete
MTVSSEKKRILVSLPTEVLEEIDIHIRKEHITRTKWFVDAAHDKIKKDNKRLIDEVVKKK